MSVLRRYRIIIAVVGNHRSLAPKPLVFMPLLRYFNYGFDLRSLYRSVR